MMRHIDADALIKKIFPYDLVDKRDYSINAKAVYDAIQNAPTEEVVPKSKIDELKKDRYQVLPDGRLELLPRTDIDEIKAQVAREIFEEIEKTFIDSSALPDCARFVDIDKFAEIKKKYVEDEYDRERKS